jgi:hypothetical protein
MAMMDVFALGFFIDASGPSCLRARGHLSYSPYDLLGKEGLMQQQAAGDGARGDR